MSKLPVMPAAFHAPLGRLVIDLDAAARNWLFLKKKLAAGADCAAVVKADAYGLGAAEISAALFAQGCRHFFVAQPDEAVLVKSALPSGEKGHDVSIYILNGPRGMKAGDMAATGFIPVLNSLEDIEYWAQAGGHPAVVHIDTGMNRLGLTAAETRRLATRRDFLSAIDIRYVMSHLACSEDPAHAKNKEQLSLFQELSSALGRPFRYSLANSGGIFLGADYHFDLARPGCAIYGINPTVAENPMQGVVRLEGVILQVRDIETAGTVGYGAGYKVSPSAKTATVSVGYADGYLRSLEGRGKVFIGGISCPVIGRVSMDLIVVDVTHLAEIPRAGDFAEIIGPHQTVDAVASQAGTIGYEILTGLGRRMKRTYEGFRP